MTPGYFHCPRCGLVDRDPELVYQHTMRRECRRDERVPEWVRRGQEKRLPAKVLAA